MLFEKSSTTHVRKTVLLIPAIYVNIKVEEKVIVADAQSPFVVYAYL